MHNYEIHSKQITFQSKADFLLWKEIKEKELRCSYIKAYGTRRRSNRRKIYYMCHRSLFIPKRYKTSTQDIGAKRTKSQGSVEMDYGCPSTLVPAEPNQTFQAKLFMPHVGHECAPRHLNLTKMKRTAITGKISEGISFDRILDDIRDTITSKGSLERISLLDRQALRDIKKQFGLNSHQYHKDDVISVDLWIKHMQPLGDESPALYYKQQQTEDEATCFELNDFCGKNMCGFNTWDKFI